MRKILIPVLLAAIWLAACGTAATPTVTPVQATFTLPPATLTLSATEETQIPSLTATPTSTLVVSGNVITRGNAVFAVTSSGKIIAIPLEYIRYEKVISKLTGGEKIAYVFYYDMPNQQNKVATITGNPVKIWFDGIVRVCTSPCKGEYVNMPGVKFDIAVKKLKDDGKATIAALIEDARKSIDTGTICMASKARFGEIFPCADMPTPTITPSPTLTSTPSQTQSPTLTPSSTVTPSPSQTPDG